MKRLRFRYGTDVLEVATEASDVTVIQPRFVDRAGLYSEIPADELRRAHVEPVADVGARLAEELQHAHRDAPVAVLPEGPMTIPYLRR